MADWRDRELPGIDCIDDDNPHQVEQRAARHGLSAEAELRDLLWQALDSERDPDFDRLAAVLRKLTAGRTQTPAEVLQRESRDER